MKVPETAFQFFLSFAVEAAPAIPSPEVQPRTGLLYLLLIALVPVLIALFF